VREVGNADKDEKINQQNVVLFSASSVIRELTSLQADKSTTWLVRKLSSP